MVELDCSYGVLPEVQFKASILGLIYKIAPTRRFSHRSFG
jgi:hypothetical protein